VTRVAEAAQHAILAPPPAQIGPVSLAARYVSAAAEALVGGDLYEVVARPGAVRLLIGDVRGKGLAAVRTATVVLGEFRAAAADVDDLAEVARQIDRRVRAYLSEEDFITALIAEVADDGTFTVAVCGHPPALLASGDTVTAIDCAPTLPLGLGAEPTLATGRLAVGDRLVLMTDGILEARGADHEFVDLAGLVSAVGRGGLDAALDQVLAALHAAVGPELGDDLALLAAEFTGRTD
jgi:serine phosphatase RsbU (regulator of sigma subunit)